jgi:hypothetical protein
MTPKMTIVRETEMRDGRASFLSPLLVFVLLVGCNSPLENHDAIGDPPLDIGADSPPGLVCGVLDQNQVHEISGTPASSQHERSAFQAYPDGVRPVTPIDCTVLDGSTPQKELIGVTVDQNYTSGQALDYQRILKAKPGGVKISAVWGDGAVFPEAGGYLLRECGGGGKYLVIVSTQSGAGEAIQWLHMIESAVLRADEIGFCRPRATVLPSNDVRSSGRRSPRP